MIMHCRPWGARVSLVLGLCLLAGCAAPTKLRASQSPAAIVSDIDRPTPRLAERPDDYALVVGVEKYASGLPEARFAERDAFAVKDHLRALGFAEQNIKFLIGPDATGKSLAAALEDWLPRNVKPDGRVFFYFAGHGAPDAETGQAYLVPADGDPNTLKTSGYRVQKLYASLGALKARRVIVVLDACFSGAGGRSVSAKGVRPPGSSRETELALDSKITLFATVACQQVTTVEKQGHGIFTYYFLKGLSGEAGNADGVVTPRGLADYLRSKVQDAADLKDREQTPVLEKMDEGELFRF
jgi:hypothetical protein